MIDWMLNEPPPVFEVTRGVLLVVSAGDRWEPAGFQRSLGWAEAFFERWPDYLVKDLDVRRV